MGITRNTSRRNKMKKLLLTIILYGACGITPPTTQPYGCDGQWICICDYERNCEWSLICS